MTPDNKESSDKTVDGAASDAAHDPLHAVENEATQGSESDIHESEILEGVLNGGEGFDEVAPEDLAQADPDEALGEPLDEMAQLQQQLAAAEAKASEHWDRLLRLQAEMENQRKRAQNDVTKARKFALEGIVNDLLPVRDSLEMGLAAATVDDVDAKAIVEGADLTLKMLAQLFEKNNIAEINPVDEKFDPEFHQAMSMQEIEGIAPNTVTNVMQKGYTLNDRLVRPALVMVSK